MHKELGEKTCIKSSTKIRFNVNNLGIFPCGNLFIFFLLAALGFELRASDLLLEPFCQPLLIFLAVFNAICSILYAFSVFFL
jgi:hypothetical protein